MNEKRPAYELLPLGVPERLRKFFTLRGQRDILLQLSAVEKIPAAHQQGLVEIAYRCQGTFGKDIRRLMESIGPMGCLRRLPGADTGRITLGVVELCDGRFAMKELEALQEIIELYKDERLASGDTVTEEPCVCGGLESCPKCKGRGVITVADEMTEEERAACSE